MKPPTFRETSHLPEPHIELAVRLRNARGLDRLSQYELARDLALPRSTVANYESGRARLPFLVGLEFCRRLDLNLRWLATGEEPKRPFVPLEEIDLDDERVRDIASRSTDFIHGFQKFLRDRLEVWVADNPPERLIPRMLAEGPASTARRASIEQLEASIVDFAIRLKTATPEYKAAMLVNLEIFTAEMRRRLEMYNPAALRAVAKWRPR